MACLRAKTSAEVLAAQTKVRQSGSVAGTRVLPSDPLELLKAGTLTKRATHARIDSEHNCTLWDEVSPAP